MKKIYIILCAALAISVNGSAQTIANAGMETWRSGTSGTETIYAPTSWYGMDSLIIFVGETFLGSSDWHAQLFQSTTVKNSGTSSAKLITLHQDTLGYFPGILTNAQPTFNLGVILAGGSPITALGFTGGTNTTLKTRTVSAYVNYTSGIDSSTHTTGIDSGSLLVQAISTQYGNDSVVGTGTVTILPTSGAFHQVTANVTYADSAVIVSKVRIIFASSNYFGGLDSSTLYVDDVTMTGTVQEEAVSTVTQQNAGIKVYPNPATNTLNFDGVKVGQVCTLIATNGQEVAKQKFAANNSMNIAQLAAGTYFYTITDTKGNNVQKGKVTVSK